ncbi:hypothetical protein BH10PSE1_BH10PSE1_28290 [soil metagenome]
MRAAVGWSMRDLAERADVALASVLKIERGERVSHRLEQRVQAAFAAHGVKSWRQKGGTMVSVLDEAPPMPTTPADKLRAMPWVSVTGDRHKVEFRVPSLHRPDRWPQVQRLPLTGPQTGNLSDPAEVAAIKRDALTLGAKLAKMTEVEGSPATARRA